MKSALSVPAASSSCNARQVACPASGPAECLPVDMVNLLIIQGVRALGPMTPDNSF